MKKENVVNYLIKLFWIFIIGSIIGYVVEMIVAFVQEGHIVSRKGLLYGPFIQVYGIGALLYYLTVPKIKGYKKIFLFSMIMGGIVEYLCSYIQEKCFGTVSWDYSHLLFNINGRTSLLHCMYWGGAGVLFVKFICPLINYIENVINRISFRYITIVFALFMAINISLSSLAATRQKERAQNIKPKDNIDIFFDQYYPDTVMNKVYTNKINRTVVE